MLYITKEELADYIDFDKIKEYERLFLVKWKNLSYLDSTWETESSLNAANKINDFRIYNRALDKESRTHIQNQVNRHKTLIELLNNPKKRAKFSQSLINDIYNKLYGYDVANNRQAMQYSLKTQPIYKERKLLRDYQIDSLNWF